VVKTKQPGIANYKKSKKKRAFLREELKNPLSGEGKGDRELTAKKKIFQGVSSRNKEKSFVQGGQGDGPRLRNRDRKKLNLGEKNKLLPGKKTPRATISTGKRRITDERHEVLKKGPNRGSTIRKFQPKRVGVVG